MVKLKYLGMTITNKIIVHEEVNSSNSENTYSYSLEKLLSYLLLSKNLKIYIHKHALGFRWESRKERDHWDCLDVGGWTILKWIL
jgi:DNA modification methylase